ncbi:hypothetical protein AB0H63_06755 [Micromonospora echinospora]|uniref:hypothetical protein n=1 Tax=Micromonospora echinospora TaxID=1877 RepID=UPI003407506A
MQYLNGSARHNGPPVASWNEELPAAHTSEDILDLAEQILVRDCMARSGFRVWLTPPNPIPEDKDFPYVVDDIAWAQQHGYGSDIEKQIEHLRSEDPNGQYFATLSSQQKEAASVALHGPAGKGVEVALPSGGVVGHSDRGCGAEAQRKLYGDFANWYRMNTFVKDLVSERRGLVLGDHRYKTAVLQWADCMRAQGMAYGSPMETRDAVRDKKRFDRGAEIRLATAEAGCAARSGLSGVAHQLDQHYAEQLKKRYAEEVTAEARLRETALPRATEIIDAQRADPPGRTTN